MSDHRRILVCALLALAAGCASTGRETRFSRHLTTDPWTGALARQVEDPGVYVPEAVLLAALPVVASDDRDLQARMERHPSVTGDDATRGDVVAVALGVAMAGLAGGRWAGGDEGRSLEVAAESLVVTSLVTSGLKRAIGRDRPHGSSRTSLPSGHTSISFAAATFLARSIRDAGDDWTYSLGYLAYLPAAYVQINRVESGHHFPADVVSGALLGTLLTNLVYDAHYGDDPHPGIFAPNVSVAPAVAPDFLGVTVALTF